MAALTVACCNVGDYLGMGQKYVDTLRSMCARHCPPHEFVCITEAEQAGYWCKLELFRPGRFTGNVLYLDLDVVISDRLHGLVDLLETGDFWALDDFAWPLSRAQELAEMHAAGTLNPDIPAHMVPRLGGFGTCNSSVMLWNGDAGRDIWEQYTPEAAADLHGDQNWITRVMGERIHLIPAGWAGSYRLGPEGCPITVYHGEGKPHEVHDPDWH